MKDTADKILKYVKENPKFAKFIKHPSKEALQNNPELIDIVVDVLTSYKNDKERIRTNVKYKILDKYAKIYRQRIEAGMGDMYLIVTFPYDMSVLPYIPYAAPGTPRGERGELKIGDYGEGGHIAARWTIIPFYQILPSLLDEFHAETGIPVSLVSLLGLEQEKKNIAHDGHLTEDGEDGAANKVAADGIEIVTPEANVAFNSDGQAIITYIVS